MQFLKEFRAHDDESQGGGSAASQLGQKIVGDIFKKAVTMGASAVERAESTVNKTLALNPASISKEMLRDVLEGFFENYTVNISAEIKLSPKKKSTDKTSDEENKK